MTDSRAAPLVVLLPPLGCDARIYAALAREAQGHARVVGIDYPLDDAAHEGTPFDWEGSHLLERLAHAFAGRIRALGDARTILGGLSLGGTLSLLVARELRPAAMFLLAPGGLPAARVRRSAILAAMDASTPLDFARRSLGIDASAFDDSGFSSHFRGRPVDAVEYFDHLACTWSGDAATMRAAAYSAMLRAALDVDLESTALQNQIPTDLVWGEEDRVFPSRIYARYARTLGTSKLHLLPRVGHFAPLEASGALAAILTRRIAEL